MTEQNEHETPAPAEETETTGRTRTEQFTISGEKLLSKVKELINEGSVRKIILKNDSGRTLLEIPLTAGLAVTAVAAVFAPVLVAVGAIAAMVTSVSLVVVREVDAADPAATDAASDAAADHDQDSEPPTALPLEAGPVHDDTAI